jgi:hypothetical protein
MDFQTVIFNRLKEIFTEGTKAGLAGGVAGTLGVGGLAAAGYYANKGVNWVQGQKTFRNPVSTPDAIARQTASDHLAKYGTAGSPANHTYASHANTAATGAADHANTAATHVAGAAPNVHDQIGHASAALSQQAGVIKDIGKSAVGHAADFTTKHPGAAIAAGAIGTAAWLARRRALKNANRGL